MAWCPKCGFEHHLDCCPNCGSDDHNRVNREEAPYEQASVQQKGEVSNWQYRDKTEPDSAKKKSPGKTIIWMILLVFLISGIAGSIWFILNLDSYMGSLVKDNESSAQQSIVVEDQDYEKEYTSGNYLVGTDLPEGTYTITLVQGNGAVYLDDERQTAQAIPMGSSSNNEQAVRKVEKVSLKSGAIFIVERVSVVLYSEDADPDFIPIVRELSGGEEKELPQGSYTAGRDFAEGTYDITAIKGNGFISTDMLHGKGYLDIEMGVDAESGSFIQNYKNVELKEGTVLSMSGVRVKLVPSS